jgi:fructose-1,6-bisphosphatase
MTNNGGQDLSANDILHMQMAAYEHVKDLASKDEKEKLYFIDSTKESFFHLSFQTEES